MEIVKRQRGRKIPFYFTITPKEYIEMKKADCEIDGKESAERRSAWRKYKESRGPAGTRNAAEKNTLNIF